MIVKVTLDADPLQGEAPVTIQLGVVNPAAALGEPHVTLSWDGTSFDLADMREYMSGLEETRRKYQEIMRALGK